MIRDWIKRLIMVMIIIGLLCCASTLATEIVADGTCGDNLTWTLDDAGTLTISGTGPMTDDCLWVGDQSRIKNVVIRDGVSSIGSWAFLDCQSLTSVTIPDSVTSIGEGAFSCAGLTSIMIPSSVTSIGFWAFGGSTTLTSIDVDPANTCYSSEKGVLFNKNKSVLIVCPAGKQGSYEIPNSVASISSYAFCNCVYLTNITIPSSVISIEEGTFGVCDCLKSIIIPDSVTSIGRYAFSDCDALMSITLPCIIDIDENAIPSATHRIIHHKSVAEDAGFEATCEMPGLNIGSHCEACGEIIEEQQEISALGHDWKTPTYTWSTDNTTATAYRVCNRDASHIETETVNAATTITLPATCNEMGQTTYTATFSNQVFATQAKTLTDIPALDHRWGTPTYTWSADNTSVTAKRVCNRDASHVETETVNVTATVTMPATCTNQGKTTYTSSAFINSAFSVQTKILTNISALGHQWNTPTYNWSADNTTVTAKRICAHDASHIETETASVTAAITKPATCTEEGQTTYTSSAFANNAFSVQTKTLTNIDALGHDWGASVYTWSADNSKVTAKRICSHDSSHVETETVNATAEVTRPATCTEKGQTTYTSAAFANNAFSVQTKTLTDISLSGHTIVTDPAVAPTDCRPGLTEGSHCSVCNEILTMQEIIHPLLWEIDETVGQVTILRYYGSETNVTIPSSLEGLPVRAIAAGAFPYSSCPARIFIPNSVQSISNTAFGRNVTVYCHEYSEADYWADEADYTAIYVDNTVSGTFYRITMPVSFTMEYGETRNLGAVVWPLVGNDTITVTSSDPSVISVKGEKLTALTVGQTTVTLRAGGKSASVVVTVHANPVAFFIEDGQGETNDTYYVLTKATKQLSVGGIQPVGAEMTVIWTSSNESVAIVSATGEVTAKRPGQAVITATAQNGLSRSCKIIVCYPVSEISFEQNTYDIPLGGRKQIKALVFTSDGDYINQLVSFSSSDESIATVDQHGIIKALKRGTVTITATADNGVSADCTLNIQAAPSNQYIFSLPAHLTTIESEAFANLPAVKGVRIPAGVKFIANDAFAGSNVIILALQGSYAAEWALDHGMTVIEE